METSTGKIIPSGSFCVFALNCLQKSMMLTPWGPSAVPTGGAGVALPAASCNLIVVCIFFGGMFLYPKFLSFLPDSNPAQPAAKKLPPRKIALVQLLDTRKIKFHRSRTPENRDRNLQPAVVVVDLFHRAVEIREWPVHNPHLLIAFVNHFWLRTILRRMHAVDDAVHLRIRQRRRRSCRTYETRHPRCISHDVPGVLVEVHFNQHVARIGHPRRNHLLAATHFHDIFHRNQHAADLVLQTESSHTAFEAFLYLLLEARIGVNDVPLHAHGSLVLFPFRVCKYNLFYFRVCITSPEILTLFLYAPNLFNR